jgi:hypothetical protein
MSGSHRVIGETQFNVLGTFEPRQGAVAFVAAMLAVKDEDYLAVLTVTHDEDASHTGDSLRETLQEQPSLQR